MSEVPCLPSIPQHPCQVLVVIRHSRHKGMSISHLVYNKQAIKSIGLLHNAEFVSFTEEKAKQTIQISSYSRENCLLSKMHLQKQMLFLCSCLGAVFGACLGPAYMHMSQSPLWNTQLKQNLRNHSTFFLEHLLSNTSEVTNSRHSTTPKVRWNNVWRTLPSCPPLSLHFIFISKLHKFPARNNKTSWWYIMWIIACKNEKQSLNFLKGTLIISQYQKH